MAYEDGGVQFASRGCLIYLGAEGVVPEFPGAVPPDNDQTLPGEIAWATLDAIPDHLAVLDETGTTVFVNAAWRRFARQNDWIDPNPGLGWNYLGVCEAAAADGITEAGRVAAELRAIYNNQPVDLNALVGGVVDQVSLASEQHEIVLSLPNAPVIGLFDPARINQVLLNLLTNAMKYSPNGGRIDVRLETSNGLVSIHIKNRGVGIAPDLLPRLFDRYYRVPGQVRDRVAGLVLGLYLSQAIAEAHGGAIAVSSTPGTGSIFTIQMSIDNPRR